MCRPKPGPRCIKHATKSLTAARAAVERARTELTDAQAAADPARIESARRKTGLALDRFDRKQADVDATRTGRKNLTEAIATAEAKAARGGKGAKPAKQEAAVLRDRLARANAINTARREQAKLMPALGDEGQASQDASLAYAELGKRREALARLDAQAAVAPGDRQRARITQLRETAERDAYEAEVRWRLAQTHGLPTGENLSEPERAEYDQARRLGQRSVVATYASLDAHRATAASGRYSPAVTATLPVEAGFAAGAAARIQPSAPTAAARAMTGKSAAGVRGRAPAASGGMRKADRALMNMLRRIERETDMPVTLLPILTHAARRAMSTKTEGDS
jgi:hypothetical protein